MRFRRIAVTATGTALAAVAIGATSAGAATFANSAPFAFPQTGTASPYPSQITVTGQTAPISDLSVNFNGFTHPAPADLRMVLVGPGGPSLLLLCGVGGDGGATGGANNATLKFDDSSGIQLPGYPGNVVSGTFKPTNYCSPVPSFPQPGPLTNYSNPGPGAGGTATLATVFNGSSANGAWSLYVNDAFVGGGTGQFAGGWSLEISADPATQTKKKCKKGRKLKKGKCVKKKKKKKKKK